MTPERISLDVLRAVLRCARHRRVADRAALTLRIDCSADELDDAIRLLERCGFVLTDARTGGTRLTMHGFAVAIASIPRRVAHAPPRARSAA